MRSRRKRPDVAESETKEMLSLEEAAGVLGVSRSTMHRWQQQGRLRGVRIGRQWRYRRSELEKLGQVTHPSAAAVNIAEVGRAVAQTALEGAGEQVSLERPALGYPGTIEEQAIYDLFRKMLAEAAGAGASDIHIDAERDASVVRQRVDGVLHEVARLPRSAHDALVACIKAHADIPLDQRGMPGDGRLAFKLGERGYDTRVATIPAVFGESVVMRLLDQRMTLMRLDGAHGMYPEDLEKYRRALRQPCGMLLVCGPTGSGKTTIMYAGLLEISNPAIKMMSIEDPVEYSFPHVTQIAVNRKAGLTFEAGMRAMLRHDPDVVMVGEIRSLEGAETAAQIAITGHLVLTQLHAETAAAAVTRLFDMGVEPFMVSQTLIYVSAQRLARKVCPECKQSDEPDVKLLSSLAERARRGGYELPEKPAFLRGAGCDHCRHTGYRGRIGIYEVMEIDSRLRRLIARRAATEEIEAEAVRNGMHTLAADGLRKAAEGITSVAEAARVVPEVRG
ncbi:MAG: ATPase, T2SS/T4P/T4SS family [Armatimonadota bacterium]